MTRFELLQMLADNGNKRDIINIIDDGITQLKLNDLASIDLWYEKCASLLADKEVFYPYFERCLDQGYNMARDTFLMQAMALMPSVSKMPGADVELAEKATPEAASAAQAAPAESAMTLHLGSALQEGKYVVDSVLGQGGFGITYKVLTKQVFEGSTGVMTVDVPLAMKEFFMKDNCARDPETSCVSVPTASNRDLVEACRSKFVKEARNLSTLNHHHIVHIIDIFEENNTIYYLMQYMNNGSLRDKVVNGGPMSEPEAKRYILQIADALNYMHTEHRMCHLDIKPGNVLLNDDDEAVLIDFGISKNYDESGGETSSTPVGLSRGYAPLEQYQQSLSAFSPETDVYSLGATFYNLLTAQTPPDASEVNENGIGPKPDGVSDYTWDCIAIAMQPRRKDRPQSISEFVSMLNIESVSQQPAISQQPIISQQPVISQQPYYSPQETLLEQEPVPEAIDYVDVEEDEQPVYNEMEDYLAKIDSLVKSKDWLPTTVAAILGLAAAFISGGETFSRFSIYSAVFGIVAGGASLFIVWTAKKLFDDETDNEEILKSYNGYMEMCTYINAVAIGLTMFLFAFPIVFQWKNDISFFTTSGALYYVLTVIAIGAIGYCNYMCADAQKQEASRDDRIALSDKMMIGYAIALVLFIAIVVYLNQIIL